MAKRLRHRQSLPFSVQDRKAGDKTDFDSEQGLDSRHDDSRIAYDSVVFDILMESPERLAAQITLLDIAIFKQILPEELVGCAWVKRDKGMRAPHISAITQRFNCTCFWVQNEILDKKKVRIRSEVICWFIKLAKKLYELNNVHALKAVVSGLQSASIYRLSRTWTLITRKEKCTLDKLQELLAANSNSENLREHMNNVRNPAIPYLGLYLTDLMYINAAYSKFSMDNVESDKKAMKVNNIIRLIASFQESDYDYIEPVPYIQEYLKSFKYIEELQSLLEAEYYRKSLEVEPENINPVVGPDHQASVLSHLRADLESSEKIAVSSLPRLNDRTNHKHPLDDSIIDDLKRRTDSNASVDSTSAETASLTSLQSDYDLQGNLIPCANISMQGCLRKTTYLKHGRKPKVIRWKTYWAVLINAEIYFFERKFNRSGNERSSFKSEYCKNYNLAGWLIVFGDYQSPHIVSLCNVEEGNKFKIDAKTTQNASIWHRYLIDASSERKLDNSTEPNNLMTFD